MRAAEPFRWGSLEFQRRIYGNFYLALFYDAGQVGPSLTSLGISKVWVPVSSGTHPWALCP